MEFIGDEHRRIEIDRVVDRREHAVHHQLLDDLGARGLEAQRELADCDLLGHGDRDVLRLALGRDAVQALGLCLTLCAARLAAALALLVDLLLRGDGFVLHLVVGEAVVLLVVLVDVDIDGSRIDNTAGRRVGHLAGSCRRRILLRALLRLAVRTILRRVLLRRAAVVFLVLTLAALALLRGLLIARLCLLLRLFLLRPAALLRRGPFLRRCGLRLRLIARCEIRVEIFRRVVLRELIEHDVELLFLQRRHVLFRLLDVLAEDV